MTDLFEIISFRNQTRLNSEGTEAHIRPLLELSLDRAATLFISQTLDGMEMFAPVRYELEKGSQSVFLKPMRVIRPSSAPYKVTITVSTSAAHAEIKNVSEEIVLVKGS